MCLNGSGSVDNHLSRDGGGPNRFVRLLVATAYSGRVVSLIGHAGRNGMTMP